MWDPWQSSSAFILKECRVDLTGLTIVYCLKLSFQVGKITGGEQISRWLAG